MRRTLTYSHAAWVCIARNGPFLSLIKSQQGTPPPCHWVPVSIDFNASFSLRMPARCCSRRSLATNKYVNGYVRVHRQTRPRSDTHAQQPKYRINLSVVVRLSNDIGYDSAVRMIRTVGYICSGPSHLFEGRHDDVAFTHSHYTYICSSICVAGTSTEAQNCYQWNNIIGICQRRTLF